MMAVTNAGNRDAPSCYYRCQRTFDIVSITCDANRRWHWKAYV